MEINEKLKKARLAVQFTQEQVAENIMVSRQTISNWENGKSIPDIAQVIKLSDLYQISLDELLKEDHKKKEKIEMDLYIKEQQTNYFENRNFSFYWCKDLLKLNESKEL